MTFSGSYAPEDVRFLLEPAEIAELSIAEKERRIDAGEHYSDFLSAEKPPTEAYLSAYEAALARNGDRLAGDVAVLARSLAEEVGPGLTIVSLARAGTPIGVLLKRLLDRAGIVDVAHYSISIVRDRGLDFEALRQLVAARDPSRIRFVDGWTGKGVIRRELRRSLAEWRGPALEDELWVVSDLSGTSDRCATRDDYLIPSAILGGTISGLVSRTVWSSPGLHRCRRLPELSAFDGSRAFIERILASTPDLSKVPLALRRNETAEAAGAASLKKLLLKYGMEENKIKPGLGESTRVLLRRMPRLILIRDPAEPDVAHLQLLARERGAPVEIEPSLPYQAAALIATAGD